VSTSRALRLVGPASSVLGPAFVVVADWQALQPWGSPLVYDLGEFAFLAFGMTVPLVILGLCAGLARGSRTDGIVAALTFAIAVAGFATMSRAHRHLRHAAVPRVETAARPLVRAIDAYTRRHGRPPASLAALVPGELSSIPATGMSAFPAFRYELRGVAGHPPAQTDDPWMVRVDTAFGMNFDSMVYVPSGRYPAIGWGGAVVPIGAWAYVWE
jgi:hypothetical protein